MFEQSILLPQPTNKRWTFAASVIAEVSAVSVLLLIPLIYTEHLGNGWIQSSVSFKPPQPPPPIRRVEMVRYTTTRATRIFTLPNFQAALTRQPSVDIEPVSMDDPPPCPTCVPGGVSGGSVGDFGIGTTTVVPPPPPPPKPKPLEAKKPAEPTGPVRVSLGTQEAKIIRRVIPMYPSLARTARVQGTVRLMGVISKEGRIEQLQVISGHPLLVQAAVDAVKQWTYHPTLLSGQPVEVMAPIDVNFILN